MPTHEVTEKPTHRSLDEIRQACDAASKSTRGECTWALAALARDSSAIETVRYLSSRMKLQALPSAVSGLIKGREALLELHRSAFYDPFFPTRRGSKVRLDMSSFDDEAIFTSCCRTLLQPSEDNNLDRFMTYALKSGSAQKTLATFASALDAASQTCAVEVKPTHGISPSRRLYLFQQEAVCVAAEERASRSRGSRSQDNQRAHRLKVLSDPGSFVCDSIESLFESGDRYIGALQGFDCLLAAQRLGEDLEKVRPYAKRSTGDLGDDLWEAISGSDHHTVSRCLTSISWVTGTEDFTDDPPISRCAIIEALAEIEASSETFDDPGACLAALQSAYTRNREHIAIHGYATPTSILR